MKHIVLTAMASVGNYSRAWCATRDAARNLRKEFARVLEGSRDVADEHDHAHSGMIKRRLLYLSTVMPSCCWVPGMHSNGYDIWAWCHTCITVHT